MSEPENFLSRWSRKKRAADAAPEAGKPAVPAATQPPAVAQPIEEPAFDLSKLPSLEEIGANTDISMFMKPGVPAALRHAALRRAWVSDPAIRDFRGLQENAWDFNAPDGVPGFGTFKSPDEIRALAQRLFGTDDKTEERVPQSAPADSAASPAVMADTGADGTLDKSHEPSARVVAQASDGGQKTASQHDEDVATQRGPARRHGGALPQ